MTLLELLMRQARATPVDLAREIGATPASVSNWIGGRSRPAPVFARALAEHFDATIERLLLDVEFVAAEIGEHPDLFPEDKS